MSLSGLGHLPPGAGPVAGTKDQARPQNARRRRKATTRY